MAGRAPGRRPRADPRRQGAQAGRATRPSATTSRARSASTRARSRCARLRKGSRVIGGTILGRIGRTDAAQGAAPRLLDPPGRPGRAADRPEADPRRLEAARGDRDLPRLRPQRPLRRRRGQPLDRPDPAAAEAAARAARARRRRASRSTRAAATTSAPARSTAACSPRSSTWPSPGCGPTVTSLKCGHGFYTSSGNVSEHSLRQRGRHRQDQRHPDPRPPGAGRHHRADGAPADAAPGHDARRTRSSRCSSSAAHTLAMADHADHIHVGFQPLFGANRSSASRRSRC